MSVARVTEITASSKKSFKDAVENGIERANKTLENVKGAWIQEQTLSVDDGKISEYRGDVRPERLVRPQVSTSFVRRPLLA